MRRRATPKHWLRNLYWTVVISFASTGTIPYETKLTNGNDIQSSINQSRHFGSTEVVHNRCVPASDVGMNGSRQDVPQLLVADRASTVGFDFMSAVHLSGGVKTLSCPFLTSQAEKFHILQVCLRVCFKG